MGVDAVLPLVLDILLGAVSCLVLVDEKHLWIHGLLQILQVVLPFPAFLVINHIKGHYNIFLRVSCYWLCSSFANWWEQREVGIASSQAHLSSLSLQYTSTLNLRGDRVGHSCSWQ